MRHTVSSVVAVMLLLTAGVAPVVASSTTGATQANCSFPGSYTDATGTEVTVEEKPERVVTLAPSAAQTMWEIGGKSQVVGVSQYASYLEGADSRTNVSGEGRTPVSVEKVVATEPDLVLAPNIITNETVQRLRDAGLTVYRFEAASDVEDIYAKTIRTGELTGNCEGATETVSWMKDRIETVQEAVENSESPSVFVSIGGGWTAGEGTFINEMLELAGGTNVAVEAGISGYGKISEEVIVDRNPEWIVQVGPFGVYPKTEAYNNTDAVKNDQVITVSEENLSQPAPRVVNAVVELAKAFHPEAFAEADATAETTTTTEATETSETTVETTQPMQSTTATTETTTDEGAMVEATTADGSGSSNTVPGFGLTAALVALAGAALLAARR